MDSVKNGSSVSNVSGDMTFEWNDLCDGWAVEQRITLLFNYADGENQELSSSELTWESKDGKRYSFNVRRLANGQETEAYRGKAVKNPDGSISVSYTLPSGQTKILPPKTLFPLAHTSFVLNQAAQGKKFFSSQVFDGSDTAGSSDISAFILPLRAVQKGPVLSETMKKNALLKETPWPVHLAFFGLDSETSEPDYEMDLFLLPNGIARSMKIDYGDFSIAGSLENLQALKPKSCP